MCTLILAWQVFDETPVVVAANRDERLDRPSEPPRQSGADPAVVAPRDERAGGTWIGINDDGCFAGITNRWTDTELEATRSRGHLVGDALTCQSAVAARDRVEAAVSADSYDGFSLVVADAADAFCLEWDGTLQTTRFDPGVHVVVNVGVDDRFSIPHSRQDAGRKQATNARAVMEALDLEEGANTASQEVGDASSARVVSWLESAANVLGDHEYGVCIHGDGFGTRSSSLIALGDCCGYAFADGPPCTTPFEPISVSAEWSMSDRFITRLEGHL